MNEGHLQRALNCTSSAGAQIPQPGFISSRIHEDPRQVHEDPGQVGYGRLTSPARMKRLYVHGGRKRGESSPHSHSLLLPFIPTSPRFRSFSLPPRPVHSHFPPRPFILTPSSFRSSFRFLVLRPCVLQRDDRTRLAEATTRSTCTTWRGGSGTTSAREWRCSPTSRFVRAFSLALPCPALPSDAAAVSCSSSSPLQVSLQKGQYR